MHFSVLHSLPIFQVRKLGTLKLEVIRQNEDFFREKVVKCVGLSGGGDPQHNFLMRNQY